MKSTILLAAAMSLAFAAVAHANEPPVCRLIHRIADPALAAPVDAVVDKAVADGFAGGVAIVRGDRLVYTRVVGFSDGQGKVPVGEHTLFHVASVTKYLTAIMVLKGVDEGKLRLDDPLSKFLPGTKLAARAITLADLLAHRSGLGSSYVAENATTAAEAVAAIDKAPIDEAKAGSFRYSNDGYDLLAIVLERAYGKRYEDIARSEILEPACISDAGFWGEVDLADPRKRGQSWEGPSADLAKRNYGMIGSAGFLITAVGLARLESELANGLLSNSALVELRMARGTISMGDVAFGSFLIAHDKLGRVVSARGYEDWGDNAIVNDYLDRGTIVAVVTSKGPKEGAGDPFRDTISKAIEQILQAGAP
jgi:CubicO group peptidase (beta-lactamase class C family)